MLRPARDVAYDFTAETILYTKSKGLYIENIMDIQYEW